MTPMIKVAHLSTAHPDWDTRIFLKECRTLARQDGLEVHWIVPSAQSRVEHGVHIHALPQGGNRWQRMVIKQVAAFRILRAVDPDIVHFHDPELLVTGLILRLMGRKTIYDAHEDLPRQIMYKNWIPRILRRPLLTLVEWFEDFVASRMSAVVAATPHIAARFRRINPNSVSVSNYPLLSELVAPGASSWDNRADTVIYSGNLSPERGGMELLEAAKISGVKIQVCGNVWPAPFQRTVEAAHEAGTINYFGQLPRDEAIAMLAQARAGIVCFHALPNHTEAQPNKLFEYMSAGLPLVASNFPLWRDMIEKADCGICVDPTDAGAIADAIRTLLADPARAQQMGLNGQKAVVETYNWDAEAKGLIALYRAL